MQVQIGEERMICLEEREDREGMSDIIFVEDRIEDGIIINKVSERHLLGNN